MATRRRVVEQHEDWLNLADAEAPWFSLPVLKRALPNGLDPTPPEVRAEHKARWYGDVDVSSARLAADRTDYLDWLLCDVVGWGADYLTGDELPAALAAGVARHDVTIAPTGVYQPAAATPVGLFDEPVLAEETGGSPSGGTRLLVFSLPAGTDPRAPPRWRHLAGDLGAALSPVVSASPCPSRAGYRRRPPDPGPRAGGRRHRLGHMAGVRVRYRTGSVGFVPIDAACAALPRRVRAGHP